MKDNIEKGDVIGAEWLNAKITLADLMQIVRAGPGISIKRVGKNIVVSTLRQGGGGGGGTSDTSHHVVADYADLASLTNDEQGDVAVMTTPDSFAYSYQNDAWYRVHPTHHTTGASPSTPMTPLSYDNDGHVWVDETNKRIYDLAGAVWWPRNFIGPTKVS